MNISKNLAKQIVEAIKQICGYDINFIDKEGIVIASTDENRIGNFHEAGQKAIKTRSTIIVENINTYLGVKKGINIPIFINDIPIAAVGVTGEPKEVSKYIFLSTKITEIFLNENLLKENLSNKTNQIDYIMQTYLYNQKEKFIYAKNLLKNLNININSKLYAITIELNNSYNLNNIKIIEKSIKAFFEECDCILNTYVFPFEFIGFLPENKFNIFKNNLDNFSVLNKDILKIGVGSLEVLEDMAKSYSNSNIAISYISNEKNYKFYEDFSIEILLNSIPIELKKRYSLEILKTLSKEEIYILKTYFENNMELKKTSSSLFIHINTLQYKLDKIYKKTGYNPRNFKDACFLYIILTFY